MNSIEIEGLVDTGADVIIIAPKLWHPGWPLQEANVQLLGVGRLTQVKQSARWVECIGPEEQIGKSKRYVASILKNLWKHMYYSNGKHRLTFPQSQKQAID